MKPSYLNEIFPSRPCSFLSPLTSCTAKHSFPGLDIHGRKDLLMYSFIPSFYTHVSNIYSISQSKIYLLPLNLEQDARDGLNIQDQKRPESNLFHASPSLARPLLTCSGYDRIVFVISIWYNLIWKANISLSVWLTATKRYNQQQKPEPMYAACLWYLQSIAS